MAKCRKSNEGFKTPSLADCLVAIGLTEEKPHDLKHQEVYRGTGLTSTSSQALLKALCPDKEFFERKTPPGRSDWLASKNENGQTFLKYTRGDYNIPSPRQNKIYILPLTFFEDEVPGDIAKSMTKFASLFFNMEVCTLKGKAKSLIGKVDSRKNCGEDQVNARQVMKEMIGLLPRDAFCMGALTLCDLYPSDDWNFVFGIADLHRRVGVYSLARHMPTDTETKHMSSQDHADLLRRACALMCHEMCHMFGIRHCIYFECLMNGSMHFEESENKPLYLCPVCLRKLHFVCRFDPEERYQQLMEFARENGLLPQRDWYSKRLDKIRE